MSASSVFHEKQITSQRVNPKPETTSTLTGYQQALISDRNTPAQEINTTYTKACGFH